MLSAIFGLTVIGAYFVVGYVVFYWWMRSQTGQRSVVGVSRRRQGMLETWGPVRFGITGFLFITMIGVFVKMAMRHAFNIKYILVTPWINI